MVKFTFEDDASDWVTGLTIGMVANTAVQSVKNGLPLDSNIWAQPLKEN
jgi:hypothetical protein